VVELSPETQARLREIFPEEASVRNPVDMIASATSESYRVALGIILEDEKVDAAIAAFVPPLGIRQVDVADAIVTAREEHGDKPVLAVLMGREGLPEGRAELHEAGVPAYIFPESAARALAGLCRYRRWLQRPVQEPATFDVDRQRVRDLLDHAAEAGRARLLEHEALAVFAAYGIPVVEHRVAGDEDEAARAADEIGYPVVVKALSADIVHKSELGVVRVDLRDEAGVRDAVRGITDAAREAGAALEGLLVERFHQAGKETIVGMTQDPSFGPVLMFGLGGIYVEALKDVTFRVQPVSEIDAREMIDSLRARRILEGVRGEAGVDRDLLVEVIQRVSQLVGEHHRIAELDINPFLARPEGGVALDARIRLTTAARAGSRGRTGP
jgi:acetyltransferase